MDWRNCVAAQVARAEDAYVTKVSDALGCQQGEHDKQHPECLSGRLATIFLPAGSGVTGSHTTSPLCWVSGRRILCGECEGEHAIQPLLPHQECHGSSLLLEVLHTMRKFASFVEQEGRHLCRHKHGMVSVTA